MSNGTAKRPILKKVISKAIDVDQSHDDIPFEPNIDSQETATITAVRDTDMELQVASEYVGKWNRLVSQTNWDKGRIIADWRQKAIDGSLDAVAYSDEAWARKVEGVTPQHVGRLRRVYARFGEVYSDYGTLFWSHFLAAIDWDDAEMWLEGATRSDWSVSQMRHQRWQTNGGDPSQTPESRDIVAVEPDDGFEALSAIDDEESDRDEKDRITTGPLAEVPDFGDSDDESNNVGAAAEQAQENFEAVSLVNPFADMPNMPDDVAEAVEHMKLAIVRHRCRDWDEIPQADMIKVVEALRKFAQMPSQ